MERRSFLGRLMTGALGMLTFGAFAAKGQAAAPGDGSHDHVSPRRGYGRCIKAGCYCRRFEGTGYTCTNCGHNTSYH